MGAPLTNGEVVQEFVRILLRSPEMTMESVRACLSKTDYELTLKKADPCKMHYEMHQRAFAFAEEAPIHRHMFGGD